MRVEARDLSWVEEDSWGLRRKLGAVLSDFRAKVLIPFLFGRLAIDLAFLRWILATSFSKRA